MKELEQSLKNELSKYKSKVPRNDGTIKGVSKRFKFMADNSKKIETDINKLSNDCISRNDFNQDEIKKVSELSTDYFLKIIKLIS